MDSNITTCSLLGYDDHKLLGVDIYKEFNINPLYNGPQERRLEHVGVSLLAVNYFLPAVIFVQRIMRGPSTVTWTWVGLLNFL